MKADSSPSEFQDRYITCCDCGDEFIFEAGEQSYYINRDLSIPKRCIKCRAIKKLAYCPTVSKGGNDNG